MKIEYPSTKNKLVKKIINELKTKAVVIFQPDDGLEGQDAGQEMLDMHQFSCIHTHKINDNYYVIFNDASELISNVISE